MINNEHITIALVGKFDLALFSDFDGAYIIRALPTSPLIISSERPHLYIHGSAQGAVFHQQPGFSTCT